MYRTNTVVIGGGQAGLAMSRCLTEQAIDHVVLERGRLGERWRSERWDSLRLLTPNWMSRLPGWRYRGDNPHGYMTMPELVSYLEDYADSFSPPLITDTRVAAVEKVEGRYQVTTNRSLWEADNVVIATGHCDVPRIPAMAQALPEDIRQVTPSRYRRPGDLPEGGVLVVGASATGVQLAHELHCSGRPVTLSVGSHIRLPRRYRGRDILWWLDRVGILNQTTDTVRDLDRARAQPSLQLVGSPDYRSIDLARLHKLGVRLVGRAQGVGGTRMYFADDLGATTAMADARLARLLETIEKPLRTEGLAHAYESPQPLPAFHPDPGPTALDLKAAGIQTVIWATGYTRNYAWLKVPVLDGNGEILHDKGVTPSPGLYVLGLRFLQRRKSSFIDGVGQDARLLTHHMISRRAARRLVAA